jgi:hypothetical protein
MVWGQGRAVDFYPQTLAGQWLGRQKEPVRFCDESGHWIHWAGLSATHTGFLTTHTGPCRKRATFRYRMREAPNAWQYRCAEHVVYLNAERWVIEPLPRYGGE